MSAIIGEIASGVIKKEMLYIVYSTSIYSIIQKFKGLPREEFNISAFLWNKFSNTIKIQSSIIKMWIKISNLCTLSAQSLTVSIIYRFE